MSDTKKVLLIDDEQDSIDYVKALLSESGNFTIISANNGLLGLDKAREYKPDLVILDIKMPGMNGFQVFKELKEEESTLNIPVIMLTGLAEKSGLKYSSKDVGIVLGTEPEAYIEKPIDPPVFKKTVLEILGL